MAEKINLRSSKVKEQKRRVADYGTETPLSSTAVERGSTRWLSGSTVVIEGLLDVTGLTTISGTLNVSGTTTLSGSTTIAGPTGITGALTIAGSMDVTGPSTFAGTLDITGDTAITGALGIEGDTTLTGNMDVLGGGKINVGNTILSPSAANGGVEFASGGGIGGNGGTVAMRGSANAGFLALSTEIASVFGGASFLDVKHSDVTVSSALINLNAPQTSVNGKLVVTNAATFQNNLDVTARARFLSNVVMTNLPNNSSPPNLFVAPDGFIYRSTWTP